MNPGKLTQCEFNNFFEAEENLGAQDMKIRQQKAIAKELKEKQLSQIKHSQVCTFWLQGLCNKGEKCSFLHSYEHSKLPVCKSLLLGQPCMKLGSCPFLHDITAQYRKECPYYARGFCKLGRFCKNVHIQKKLCPNYLLGFCMKGPNCPDVHLKSLISFKDSLLPKLSKVFEVKIKKNPKKLQSYICHRCGERGHSDDGCKNEQIPKDQLYEILMNDSDYVKKVKTIICHKCNEVGHYTIMCDVITAIKKKKEKQKQRASKVEPELKVLNEAFGETIFSCRQVFKAFEDYFGENKQKFDKLIKI